MGGTFDESQNRCYMKMNLEDLTFLMPLKVDSVIRIENLLAGIRYLQRHFKTHIVVLEVGYYDNGLLRKLLNRDVKYIFIEDRDPVFHRTKYRNLIAKRVETPFLAVWDVDVLVDKKQIIEAMEKLRYGEADFVYPYDGKFYDTSSIIRTLYMKKQQMKILHQNRMRMELIYGENHKGGAFFARTDKYHLSGMENENFYGWGEEDFERYNRWMILGLNISRVSGCMYHLSHPRDINGRFNSVRQIEITKSENIKTWKSSYNELNENLIKKEYGKE